MWLQNFKKLVTLVEGRPRMLGNGTGGRENWGMKTGLKKNVCYPSVGGRKGPGDLVDILWKQW